MFGNGGLKVERQILREVGEKALPLVSSGLMPQKVLQCTRQSLTAQNNTDQNVNSTAVEESLD